MRGRITGIMNFFVLLILLGAMTGVNVCRFYCNPCGHVYVLVNALPSEGKCYCDSCRCAGEDRKSRKTCCRQRKNHQTPLCCQVKKGKHKHSGFEHTFYKLPGTYQAEPSLELTAPFCMPEVVGYPEFVANFSFTTIQENRNIYLIKAPPLEWLCTYLC